MLDELKPIFIEEMGKNLKLAREDLQLIIQTKEMKGLTGIIRFTHTLKGDSAMMGYDKLTNKIIRFFKIRQLYKS